MIKTMLSKSDIINLTYNEICVMKNSIKLNDYYIVIVSNLINIEKGGSVEIEVIKNFSDLILSDTMQYLNSIVLDIKKIMVKYKVF